MSWDAVARAYHAMEAVTFGTALQRARTAWLSDVSDARRALVLGEGDGRFLEKLLATAPNVIVDVVDMSAKMLEVARERVQSERARFIHADARGFTPTEPYDLIVTHFILDCFTPDQVAALIDKLSKWLAPDGRWLLADFTVPEAGVRRARARFWLAVMYRFFGVAAGLRVRMLTDPTPLMEARGLRRLRLERHDADFISSALWTH